MPTLAFVAQDDLAIVVHGGLPPTDVEWDAYVEFLMSVMSPYWSVPGKLRRRRVLVVTDGGSPSALQRKKIQEAFPDSNIPTSVVTASQVARGVVLALSWFGLKIRAFAPQKWSDALVFLEVSERKPQITACLS